MEDKQIGRIQSLYDEEIERRTEGIQRKYRMDVASLADNMERETNWMQCELRSAMYKEIRKIREQV